MPNPWSCERESARARGVPEASALDVASVLGRLYDSSPQAAIQRRAPKLLTGTSWIPQYGVERLGQAAPHQP